MKSLRALVFGSLLAAMPLAAHATTVTVTGTDSFTDSSNGNLLSVTPVFHGNNGGANRFTLAVPLGSGSATYSDFLSLYTYIYSDRTLDLTDQISVSFSITQPGTGSGTLDGSATEDQTQIVGIFDSHSGTVTWNDPLLIKLAPGDQLLSISLQNITLGTTGCGLADLCGNVDATFTLAQAPEPSSFALLGTGIFGAYGVARRRFGR